MTTMPAIRGRGGLTIAVLAAAGIVAALMQSMVLPLLPRFPHWLDIGVATAQWIATSNMLAGAVTAPLLGWLGDRLGFRPVMTASLVALALGCVLSALAAGPALMIVGRVLQGCATGIVGLALAVVRDALPPARLPMAVGLVSGTLGIGTGLGIPLAALMLLRLPWQSVFWLTAVLGVLAAVAIALVVPARTVRTRSTFDGVGAVGFSALLVLVLLPVSFAPSWGLGDPRTVSLAVGAVVVGALWARHQLRRREPFVDLRLALSGRVLPSHLTALLLGITFFLSFTGTIYLSQSPPGSPVGLGGDVLTTALVQLPASLGAVAAAPLAAWVATRLGARTTVLIGSLTAALAMIARAVDLDDAVPIAVTAFLVSSSATFAFSALPFILMDAVPVDATGATNGLNIMMRQVGAATASALAATVLTATALPSGGVDRDTFLWLFGAGAVLAGLAASAMWLSRSRVLVLAAPRPERNPS